MFAQIANRIESSPVKQIMVHVQDKMRPLYKPTTYRPYKRDVKRNVLYILFLYFLLLWIINIFLKKLLNNKLHVHPAKIPEPLAYRSFQFDILITDHYKKGYFYHLIFPNFQQMLTTPIYVCMYKYTKSRHNVSMSVRSLVWRSYCIMIKQV